MTKRDDSPTVGRRSPAQAPRRQIEMTKRDDSPTVGPWCEPQPQAKRACVGRPAQAPRRQIK
jgi:hypothetical protein